MKRRSSPDFRATSTQQWLALKTLALPSRGESEREALQLLEAAVLYHANSLGHFGGDLLHERWRLPPPLPIAGAYVGQELDELSFGHFYPANERIGQMHLASAAVRLPVALQKTIEARPGEHSTFGDLWGVRPRQPKRPDWLREKIHKRFTNVKALHHCETRPLGATEEERLQHAITIVMVVRDDFGHGEEGDSGPETYMGDRSGVVDALHTCRLLEAQQLLVSWAIDRLR